MEKVFYMCFFDSEGFSVFEDGDECGCFVEDESFVKLGEGVLRIGWFVCFYVSDDGSGIVFDVDDVVLVGVGFVKGFLVENVGVVVEGVDVIVKIYIRVIYWSLWGCDIWEIGIMF